MKNAQIPQKTVKSPAPRISAPEIRDQAGEPQTQTDRQISPEAIAA
jgi:hypothetical protein